MSQSERRGLNPDWHRKPIIWWIGLGEEVWVNAVLIKRPPEWLYTETYMWGEAIVTQVLK